MLGKRQRIASSETDSAIALAGISECSQLYFL
jgi:hypothetical protein